MTSAAVATAAARATQQLHFMNITPGPSNVQAPPLFEVSHKTLQSSPAESTLTPAHTQHPQAATHLPVNIFGNDEELGQDQVLPHLLAAPTLFPGTQDSFPNNKAYENAISNELDGILEYVKNHGEKMSGNFVIDPDDDNVALEDLDEDGRGEDHGGESNEEGDEADVHNIALAHRLIDDDECDECFTKSDAKRIALSRGTGFLLGANPEIDDDFGEPTSGTDEVLNRQTSLECQTDGCHQVLP